MTTTGFDPYPLILNGDPYPLILDGDPYPLILDGDPYPLILDGGKVNPPKAIICKPLLVSQLTPPPPPPPPQPCTDKYHLQQGIKSQSIGNHKAKQTTSHSFPLIFGLWHLGFLYSALLFEGVSPGTWEFGEVTYLAFDHSPDMCTWQDYNKNINVNKNVTFIHHLAMSSEA